MAPHDDGARAWPGATPDGAAPSGSESRSAFPARDVASAPAATRHASTRREPAPTGAAPAAGTGTPLDEPGARARRTAPADIRRPHGLAGLVAHWQAEHGAAARHAEPPAPTAPQDFEQAIERLLLAELDRHAIEVQRG